MSANPIWIAGYFGPVAGASPVWIAPGDGTVPSAVQSQIVSYFAPVVGATAVWIAGFFAPPPAAIGATPITISGWGGSGGGGPPPVTSVWSAADATANGMTLSNGGLTISGNSAQNKTARTTVGRSSGKYYVEFLCVTANGNEVIGLASSGFNALGKLGASNYSGGVAYGSNWVSAGFTSIATTLGLAGTGDVAGIAVDFATGNIWYSRNNVWVAGLFSDDNVVQPRDPSSGANPIISFVPATVGTLFPAITIYDYNEVWTLQATAASQKYAPPSGFSAWDGGVAPPPTSVWSSSDAAATGMTLSNGGLTVTNPNAAWKSIRGTVSHNSGKLYVEFLNGVASTDTGVLLGMADAGFSSFSYLSSSPVSLGAYLAGPSSSGTTGIVFNYNLPTAGANANDVWAIAVDLTAGKFWVAQNNVWFGSGNPATAANPMATIASPALGATYFPAMSLNDPGSGGWTLQSTAASQKYAPPSGFTPWG